MEYGIGDKIVIRKDLEIEDSLDTVCSFVKGMDIYLGKTLTVRKIDFDGDYLVEETDYAFSNRMIDHKATKNLKQKIFKFDGKTLTLNNKIKVKRHNEENDLEKAVAIALLKEQGITYSKIKSYVKSIKAVTKKDKLINSIKNLNKNEILIIKVDGIFGIYNFEVHNHEIEVFFKYLVNYDNNLNNNIHCMTNRIISWKKVKHDR